MAYELVYTSAPEGLNRGSSGFCVVACTKGIGPRLVVTLEGLSAYKPLYPHYAPNAWDNPVSRSHYLYEANGERQHILSRVCFNGVDYTQRSNKLASHLVLSQKEALAASGGPTSLLLHEELFKNADWTIKAEAYLKQKEIPATVAQVGKCTAWETLTGDAGWAGFLAQTFVDTPNRNVYIAYRPEQNPQILPLLHEAQSLLPDALRWKVTFNTYFVTLPAGMSCVWRCCPVDSDALIAARRSPQNIIIDLTRLQALTAEGPLVTAARTGMLPQKESRPPESAAKPALPKAGEVRNEPQQPSAGTGNRTMKLPSPVIRHSGPETISPARAGSFPRYPQQYPQQFPQQDSAKEKRLLKFAVIIGAVIAVLGGSVFLYSSIRENWLYTAKRTEFKSVLDEFRRTERRCELLIRHLKKADSVEAVNRLAAELKILRGQMAEIRKKTEKLKAFQELFLKDPSLGSGENNTPDALLESCDDVWEDMEKFAADLKKRKSELQRRDEIQKKRAEEEAQRRQAASGKKGPGSGKASGTPPAGRNKAPGRTAGAPSYRLDPPQYLWLKAEHPAPQTQSTPRCTLKVQVGNAGKNELAVVILADPGKTYRIGEEIRYDDELGRSLAVQTSYAKGVVTITLPNHLQSAEQKLLIRIGKGQELPLFFRLDKSKLKPGEKRKENLKISYLDKKICFTFDSSSWVMPELYFTKENVLCKPDPVFSLEGGKQPIPLTRQGKYYRCELEVDKNFQETIDRKKNLADLQKEIQSQLKKYLENKDFLAKMKEQEESCREFLKWKNTFEKYVKEFNVEDAEERSDQEICQVIIEKLTKKGDSASDRKKEEYRKIIKFCQDYPKKIRSLSLELMRFISAKIALKDLNHPDYAEKTWDAAFKEVEDALKDWENKQKKAILESTLVLHYGEEKYSQFKMNSILP